MTPRHAHLNPAAMAILVLLCASWGLQQVAIKVALPGITPILQAGLRSLGATLLILAWMVIRRIPILERDSTLGWGIAAGLLFGIEFQLIYWGLEFTNASRAVIFLYLAPFVVAVGAQLFLPHERLRWLQVIGLACAFVGIVTAFGESLTFPDARVLIGDTMLVAAAILWGATTILIKATPLIRCPPSKVLLYQLAVSALFLPLASLAMGEAGILQLNPLVVGSLLYQAVWVAFITYLLWFWLVQHYPAASLASFTFLTPLFGVLAGGWLLDEPITPALSVALLLVGIGIYLVNRPYKPIGHD